MRSCSPAFRTACRPGPRRSRRHNPWLEIERRSKRRGPRRCGLPSRCRAGEGCRVPACDVLLYTCVRSLKDVDHQGSREGLPTSDSEGLPSFKSGTSLSSVASLRSAAEQHQPDKFIVIGQQARGWPSSARPDHAGGYADLPAAGLETEYLPERQHGGLQCVANALARSRRQRYLNTIVEVLAPEEPQPITTPGSAPLPLLARQVLAIATKKVRRRPWRRWAEMSIFSTVRSFVSARVACFSVSRSEDADPSFCWSAARSISSSFSQVFPVLNAASKSLHSRTSAASSALVPFIFTEICVIVPPGSYSLECYPRTYI